MVDPLCRSGRPRGALHERLGEGRGMEDPYDLPEGWTWSTLDEVCERVEQVDPRRSPDRVFKYVDISSVDNKRNRITEIKTFAGADAPSRARKPIQVNDVLFATVRTYLRNIALVPQAYHGEIASTGFCVLRSGPNLDPRFLFRYVLTHNFVHEVSEMQRGISYPAVTDRDVYARSIPLPPLPEQQRLVEKIECLMEQSRTAREALDRIPPLLKRFRQSVLAKAFRGELTERDPNDEPASVLLERIRQERRLKWEEDLRARGKDPRTVKHVEPEAPDTRELPELPEGWVWASIGQLADVSTGATPLRSKKKAYYDGGTIPWIKSGALNDDPVMKAEEFITDLALEGTNAKLFPRGTLLVAMYGEGQTRGRVSELGIDGATNQACAAMLFSAAASGCKAIVKYYFRKTYEDIRLLSAGGVQPNLNLSLVRRTSLPLAPMAEQRRIVARIETSFSVVEAIERSVARARRQAEHVDQAVLARAFRGHL